ncbi:MAG: HEAT repeat domain-containing protein [Thermoanaerobaculia bacterium]
MKRTVLIGAAVVVAAMAAGPMYAGPDFGDRDKSDKVADKAQALAEKEESLYDDGTDALDEHDWRHAAEMFSEVARMRMTHADGAMYWLAYAQSKMGMRSEALATILDLQRTFAKSRWSEDGRALEVEIRQSAGQRIEPNRVGDEELKLLALSGLMNSDPDRAIPVIDAILKSNTNTIKVKEKALFVVAQSGSESARDVLGRTARDASNPELRSAAIKYLGIFGGESARKTLADVYASTSDLALRKSILKSFMISGDKSRLLQIAKTEQNTDLRSDAVRQLGILGAKGELADLYNTETSTAIRKSIIQAMFLGGNAEKLGEIARGEKDRELRLTAIRNLGLLGGTRSSQLLGTIYTTDNDRDVRYSVINAFFIQGNAHALVDLAKKEKDPELKKQIISKLALTGSKEAADYLMEFLKE